MGATVITFTIPDVSRRMRLGGALSAKTAALNAELRGIPGALLLNLARYELTQDPRMSAVDRIHGNAEEGSAPASAPRSHT